MSVAGRADTFALRKREDEENVSYLFIYIRRMSQQQHPIEFDVALLVRGLNQIAELSTIVAAIFQSTRNIADTEIAPLETDGLSVLARSEAGDVKIGNELVMSWVLAKAFEDIIAICSQTLITANKFVRLKALENSSIKSPFKTIDEIHSVTDKLDNEIKKYAFPTHIEKLEKELSIQLPLKEEMLSINAVRNCLVHRNGIVSKFDVTDKTTDSLVLKYCCLAMYVLRQGELLKVTKELKNEGPLVEGFIFQNENMEAEFKINSKVKIGADTFNAIIHTTVVFIQQAVVHLPLPDDVKSGLIQPLRIHMSTK